MARTTSKRKREAQAAEAEAVSVREKKWWRCDGSRRTAGEHIIIITREDQGAIEEIVLSTMVAGEDQGLEHGGLCGGDGIKCNVEASSDGVVRLRLSACCLCSGVHTHMSCCFI